MRALGGAAVALGLAGPAAACRLALVLALDVSASVDAAEYRLQLDGLAAALTAPDVAAEILAVPGWPVAVTVYEWSGPGTARTLVPWTDLDAASLAAVAASLRARAQRPVADPTTALGDAVRFGLGRLAARPGCAREVIDVSGDGRANTGARTRVARVEAEARGVTVNALVVGSDPRSAVDRRQAMIAGLLQYFRAEVLAGPGAFAEAALGYEDYEAAMRRKLLRELSEPAIGAVSPANGASGG